MPEAMELEARTTQQLVPPPPSQALIRVRVRDMHMTKSWQEFPERLWSSSLEFSVLTISFGERLLLFSSLSLRENVSK